MKINHFPEDTDYDHDSAEYLLRTWGSGTDWGHCRGWARGGKGAGHLDRRAEMSVPANPSPETFSGLGLAPWSLSRPLLSPWGGLRGGSRELIGRCAVLAPAATPCCDWLSLSGLRLALLGSRLGKPGMRLTVTQRTRQFLNYDWQLRNRKICLPGAWGVGGKGCREERERKRNLRERERKRETQRYK